MGIFRREQRATWHPSSGDPELIKLLGGTESASGVTVTADTALSNTAVWCAVSLISSSLGMLPLHVYRFRADGRNRRDIDRAHPLYRLLHDEPNPEMTAMEFREWMQASLLIRGNAYAHIEQRMNGRPASLWPLRADRMTPVRIPKGGKLWYDYRTEDGERHRIDAEDIFHIRGFSTGGLVGLCTVDLTQDAIGLGMAHEQYSSRFFANGAQPGGALVHPEALPEEGKERLRKDWERVHQGLDRSHKVAILEYGLEWKQIGVSPKDSELVDARTFQLQEVARIFHVPPHMLHELSHATFSNIEHQQIAFIMFTLAPWMERWEQRIHKDLFLEPDLATHFAEFSVEGLLRGDTKSRMEAHRTAIYSGMRTPNEVRDLENLDPKPGGDLLWMPASMMQLGPEGELITPNNQVVVTATLPGDREEEEDGKRNILENAIAHAVGRNNGHEKP